MKIICYYNKNLKMSEGKLAAQVGHVCKEISRLAAMLNFTYSEDVYNFSNSTIIVLGLRQNKFKEKLGEITLKCEQNGNLYVVQTDLGLTEVEEGTITAFGYIE